MGLSEQVQKDITEAMKARQELRLSCLRMVKAALKNREIEKRGPLDDAESHQVLATLIKQRRDSIEQFAKAGRPELVEKETAEIGVIESYLPKAAGQAEILAAVRATLAEMGSASGSTPGMKDMGAAMKNVMAKFQAAGTRVEGKTVSEIVKRELAPK
ncbi:MAG: GatB/YqeY domain-containing protein [Terriglobales bacterium]